MPPAAAAVGIGAAGALLGVGAAGVASATGVGKTRYNGTNFKNTGAYDSNRYEYGGRAGLADQTAGNFSAVKNQHQDQQKQMYGRGNDSLNDATNARWDTMRAAGRIDARAQGQNLISTRVADAARRNQGAQTQSAIASARGPAGLALAQQDATAAGAQGNAAIADAEMTNSAQEQLANERASFDAYGNIRQGDVGQANTAFGASAQTGALGAQYGQLENDVRKTQTQANLTEQQLAAQSHGQEQELLHDANARNAQTDLGYFKAGLGAVAGGAGTATQGAGTGGGTSDPKAKTGISKLGASDDYWKHAGDKGGPYDPDGPYIPRNEQPHERSMSGERYGGKSPYFVKHDDAIDLNAYAKEGYDVGEGPGERDFDADEYDAKLADKLKPYEREGDSRRGDALGEGVRFLKDDADSQMANMRASLGRGPSVQRTSDLQAEALSRQAEDIRRAQEELDLAMHQGLSAPAVNPKRDIYTPDLSPDRRDPLIRENPFGEEPPRVAHASTPSSKMGLLRLGGGDDSEISGPAGASFDKLSGDGMDVMGSLKAHSDFGTRFQSNPGASPSTPKAKTNITLLGEKTANSPYGAAAAGRSVSGGSTKLGEQASAEPSKGISGGGDALGRASEGLDTGSGYTQRKVGWSMHASDPKAKSGVVQLKPVTVQGVPWTYARGDGPSKFDDEEFERAKASIKPGAELPDYVKDIEESNEFFRGERAAANEYRARKEAPANLYGDSPTPDRSPMYTPIFDDHVSDPRAKAAAEKLGGSHSNEVADTLDTVPAVSYKYKSPYFEPDTTKPGERQAGFLTTDLKKTPLGEAVVEERPDGYEGYNTHRMIGLQHAEIRNLHERMRDLEEQLALSRGRRG